MNSKVPKTMASRMNTFRISFIGSIEIPQNIRISGHKLHEKVIIPKLDRINNNPIVIRIIPQNK